jgi:ubiquinone biosynthesis protein
MVGRLSPQRRQQVVDLLAGVARMEEQPMLEVLLDWAGDAYVDEVKLASDVNQLVFDYEGVVLKDLRIGTVVRQFTAIMRDHSIVLPADLSLMFKTLITLEGLGRQYNPEFHIVEHLVPLLKRTLRERYEPGELVKRGTSTIADFFGVVSSVPRDVARLLREARRGKTRVDLDLKRLDSFGRQLDRTLDRVTIGIMTASLVIGSAIVMTVEGGPNVLGIPVLTTLGFLGYLIAFVNSLWILYGMWRSGKE